MGWTSTNKPKNQSLKDFFEKEFRSLRFLETHQHYNEFYAACINPSRPEKVFGLVVITENQRNSYYNLTYKEMSEDAGPYYHNCPVKILNLLSPTDNPLALEWRANCLAQAKRAEEAAQAKKEVLPGTVIRFKGDGFKFRGDPNLYTTFRKADDRQVGTGRHRNLFTRINSRGEDVPGIVQLRQGWEAKHEFEVVGVDDKEVVKVSVFG